MEFGKLVPARYFDYIMGNETPIRSGHGSNTGDGAGRSSGEPASLQGRAPFLKNWHWESVVRINERLCSRDRAQHGQNSEAYTNSEREWIHGHQAERSILKTLEWLRSFHRKAPFLFFNGNTFAEIARTLSDALFAELPHGRRLEAASLCAHYVAGVIDRDSICEGLDLLMESADFREGDHVQTLKGSAKGVVRRLLSDGRVAWQPDDSTMELVALPESLLRIKKR